MAAAPTVSARPHNRQWQEERGGKHWWNGLTHLPFELLPCLATAAAPSCRWARDPAADEWEEQWGEKYSEKGPASKWADKWARQAENVWHERWGEPRPGKGQGCERALGSRPAGLASALRRSKA